MRCDDPLVRALRGFGYNLVRLPSARFAPLVLLESDGRQSTTVVGPVDRELPALDAAERPGLHLDNPAPDLTIQTTRRFSGKVAANLLQPLLAALGAGAGIAATLSRSREMSIVLQDVRRDWVDVGDIARYLESGAGSGSRHVAAAAARGQLYVVTAVLKTAVLTTRVESSAAHGVEAQATVGGPVGVSVAPSTDRADEAVVSVTGATPLAFAFQAVRLLYEDGVYTDFVTARGLTGYALPSGSGGPAEGMLAIDDDLAEVQLTDP